MAETEAQPRKPRRLRWYHRVVIYILIIYLVWCAALYLMQDTMMFPVRFMGPAGQPWREDAVVLAHDIGEGRQVVAWYFPVPGASVDQPAPLVVYFHGNGELVDYQQRVVDAYHAMGVNVLLPEYRGYGDSAGKPTQAGLVDDAVAFIEQVVTRPEVDAGRLVMHGRSIGGAVATQVAVRRKPTVLITESTFTSVAAMAWRRGVPPIPGLVKNPFRTRDVMPTLGIPILLFHGSHDRAIAASHSRRLHALTPNSRLVIYDSDHNDFPRPENEEAFWSEIRRFLEEHGVTSEF